MPIMDDTRAERYKQYAEDRRTSNVLAGKKVLVTGAASGVGLAIAEHYLGQTAAHVVAVDRDKQGLDVLAESWVSDRVTVAPCDLLDTKALSGLPRDIDVLVNCAGVLRLAPAKDYDDELFRSITSLMLEAPFLLSRNVLPWMESQGWGRLIHVTSTMGLRVQPNKSAYCSAKWGLEGLSGVLAAESAPFGVTSNTLVLSHVDTPLVHRQIEDERALHGMDRETYFREVLFAPLAIKELLPAHAVGELLRLLYGPASRFITGSSLVMDCGWTGTH